MVSGVSERWERMFVVAGVRVRGRLSIRPKVSLNLFPPSSSLPSILSNNYRISSFNVSRSQLVSRRSQRMGVTLSEKALEVVAQRAKSAG